MDNLYQQVDTANKFTGSKELTVDRTDQTATGLEWAKRMDQQPPPPEPAPPLKPIVPLAN
jgi:hypothetical protein